MFYKIRKGYNNRYSYVKYIMAILYYVYFNNRSRLVCSNHRALYCKGYNIRFVWNIFLMILLYFVTYYKNVSDPAHNKCIDYYNDAYRSRFIILILLKNVSTYVNN